MKYRTLTNSKTGEVYFWNTDTGNVVNMTNPRPGQNDPPPRNLPLNKSAGDTATREMFDVE